MTPCLIALGSNLGDRLGHLTAAVGALDGEAGIAVVAVSGLYETAPFGGPDRQGPYLNAAVCVETTLAAADLLATLHRIEAAHQSLTYGDEVSDDEALLLPHPRMHQRRFVMVPVCDVAGDLVHARLGRTMQRILADLPVEPGDLALVNRDWVTIAKRKDVV